MYGTCRIRNAKELVWKAFRRIFLKEVKICRGKRKENDRTLRKPLGGVEAIFISALNIGKFKIE
ncbi:UNVERIFIED_CONTAM: hypothetical protein NCL1_44416 [Trichonephila clavipes]